MVETRIRIGIKGMGTGNITNRNDKKNIRNGKEWTLERSRIGMVGRRKTVVRIVVVTGWNAVIDP